MLEGATYRQVTREFPIGLATVNRIVKDARRQAPDFDDLRQLSIILNKYDVALFDAMKACPTVSRLNELDVEVDQLSSYIEESTRLAEEHGVKASELVNAMLELNELKAKTGKSYGEVVEDFRDKTAQVKNMEHEVGKLQAERKKEEKDLEVKRKKIKLMLSTKERLKKIDLEKIAVLAEFAEKKEALETKLQEIRRDTERKTQKMRIELKNKEKKRELLEAELERLWNEREFLKVKISKHTKLSTIIEKRKMIAPCKNCSRESILMILPDRVAITNAMGSGLVWQYPCAYCEQWVQYSPWEIIHYIGWLAIPEPEDAI